MSAELQPATRDRMEAVEAQNAAILEALDLLCDAVAADASSRAGCDVSQARAAIFRAKEMLHGK